MKQTKNGHQSNGNWKDFIHLILRIRFPWILVLIAFAFSWYFSNLMVLLPTTMSGLLSGEMSTTAVWDAVIFLVLYSLMLGLRKVLTYLAERKAVYNARSTVWGGMLRIRMDYYDSHDPANLMSAITNDLSEAVDALVILITTLLPDIYYLYVALKTVAGYHIGLMISLLVLLPVKIGYMVFIGRKEFTTQAGVYRRIGSLTAYLAERVRHLQMIKAYTNEQQELQNGEDVAHQLYDANIKVHQLTAVKQGAVRLIELLERCVAMVFGVILLSRGSIVIEDWVAFFLFSTSISSKFNSLISDWLSLKSIQGAISRTTAIMNAPQEKVNPDTTTKEKRSESGIVFDHVSFAYDTKQALSDVSFSIPKGSSAAVVGACGSGKTTALSLIENYYQPNSGTVRLNGTSVQQVPIEKHRSQFAYVQQGADIFSGTVREALTYGISRKITDEEILQAARASGFSEYLDHQPAGLDTVVAAGGTSMSTGQRQRMVLAREFLRGADILLMDEPTASLDVVTANSIKEQILSMFDGKTLVVVTHDLDLASGMDQIVFLNDGKVAGCGTYAQLMKDCPLFQKLVAAQANQAEVSA